MYPQNQVRSSHFLILPSGTPSCPPIISHILALHNIYSTPFTNFSHISPANYPFYTKPHLFFSSPCRSSASYHFLPRLSLPLLCFLPLPPSPLLTHSPSSHHFLPRLSLPTHLLLITSPFASPCHSSSRIIPQSRSNAGPYHSAFRLLKRAVTSPSPWSCHTGVGSVPECPAHDEQKAAGVFE